MRRGRGARRWKVVGRERHRRAGMPAVPEELLRRDEGADAGAAAGGEPQGGQPAARGARVVGEREHRRVVVIERVADPLRKAEDRRGRAHVHGPAGDGVDQTAARPFPAHEPGVRLGEPAAIETGPDGAHVAELPEQLREERARAAGPGRIDGGTGAELLPPDGLSGPQRPEDALGRQRVERGRVVVTASAEGDAARRHGGPHGCQ